MLSDGDADSAGKGTIDRILEWSLQDDQTLLRVVSDMGAGASAWATAGAALHVVPAVAAVRWCALASKGLRNTAVRTQWSQAELAVLSRAYLQVRPLRQSGQLSAHVFYKAMSNFLPGRSPSAVRQTINVKLVQDMGVGTVDSPLDTLVTDEAWQQLFSMWLTSPETQISHTHAKQLVEKLQAELASADPTGDEPPAVAHEHTAESRSGSPSPDPQAADLGPAAAAAAAATEAAHGAAGAAPAAVTDMAAAAAAATAGGNSRGGLRKRKHTHSSMQSLAALLDPQLQTSWLSSTLTRNGVQVELLDWGSGQQLASVEAAAASAQEQPPLLEHQSSSTVLPAAAAADAAGSEFPASSAAARGGGMWGLAQPEQYSWVAAQQQQQQEAVPGQGLQQLVPWQLQPDTWCCAAPQRPPYLGTSHSGPLPTTDIAAPHLQAPAAGTSAGPRKPLPDRSCSMGPVLRGRQVASPDQGQQQQQQQQPQQQFLSQRRHLSLEQPEGCDEGWDDLLTSLAAMPDVARAPAPGLLSSSAARVADVPQPCFGGTSVHSCRHSGVSASALAAASSTPSAVLGCSTHQHSTLGQQPPCAITHAAVRADTAQQGRMQQPLPWSAGCSSQTSHRAPGGEAFAGMSWLRSPPAATAGAPEAPTFTSLNECRLGSTPAAAAAATGGGGGGGGGGAPPQLQLQQLLTAQSCAADQSSPSSRHVPVSPTDAEQLQLSRMLAQQAKVDAIEASLAALRDMIAAVYKMAQAMQAGSGPPSVSSREFIISQVDMLQRQQQLLFEQLHGEGLSITPQQQQQQQLLEQLQPQQPAPQL